MNRTCTDIFRATVIVVTVLYGAAGCRGEMPTALTAQPSIDPEDFALVPCGISGDGQACVLVAAGGKRVLFGAPAGISNGLLPDHLKQLDAVMLFSLTAQDIEGLDEVRNASWRAGRSAPLAVVGPEGTSTIVDALNLAFEQSDALRVVEEGIPPGGYDAAVLTAAELPAGQDLVVYDTGDFRVEVTNGRATHITYTVNYGPALTLAPCGAEANQSGVETTYTIACAGGAMVWPLTQIVFLKTGAE